MKKLLLLIASMAFFEVVNGQEILTYERAIEIGMQNNFGIKLAVNDAQIAQIDQSISSALLMPLVTAAGNYNYSRQDTELELVSDPGNPIIRDGAESQTRNANVTAIYGFQYSDVITYQFLGRVADASEMEARLMLENTVAAIATAYYRLVLEQQREEIFKRNLQFSEERLEIAKAQYEFGRVSRRDYLTAQVDYNTDMTVFISQEQVIQNAKVILNELLAREVTTEVLVNDTIIVENKIKIEELAMDRVLDNAQLLAAKIQVEAAHLQVKSIMAERLPSLNLTGAYISSVATADAAFFSQNIQRGFVGTANITINLFTGLALNRRIQSAKIQKVNAELFRNQLELQLESAMLQTYNTYINNQKLFEVELENYKVAAESSELALERYKLGIDGYLQFRDAQVNLLDVESRLINAIYLIKETEIELMRLSGKIFLMD
ncbi:TolC family protein [Pararhodonellum marinum]|uniref:TolC family protein n=1 Tax=Pararhodonellum marinum TaxID=2755358 RepID=UPI00188E47A2|nr:TolC family protein [Pararhodonellum marinum]